MLIIRYPDKSTWHEILSRPAISGQDMNAIVMPVIENVRQNGDRALYEYTEKFDQVTLSSLRVSQDEFLEAAGLVDNDLKKAIAVASHHIEIFHRSQQTGTLKIQTAPGVTCWQKPVAIEKVGLYIPGGSAPLFSTVLMLAIPARIAGCKDIVLCTPPGKNGRVHPAVLYAARLTGVSEVFKIGGAQAIAAMAYGTESVPRVYKIFGPGNQYVTAAKKIVAQGDTAIDMPAGPSELAVIADDTAIPAFVASDLLSQAEHGADSQVLLFTPSEDMASRVQDEVTKQLENLPRKEIASRSLEHSRIMILKDMREITDMVNDYAPEHLIIAMDDAETVADGIINAGSVFIGHYTPESAGDYASGTNHTLPTNGFARAYNGVNLDNYVKKITFQHITRQGLENLSHTIMKMAESEELQAHSNAVNTRLKKEHG
jgi:histidinol dehydrogenase